MITGGVASVIYGDPRFTRDVDVVMELNPQSGSDRHLRDVAMMLRISGDTVKSDVLREWLERLDLQGTLERARRFSPD